jgi:hypothetical protein
MDRRLTRSEPGVACSWRSPRAACARTATAERRDIAHSTPDARFVTTRAVTISAPAEAIWPWLVQMGQDRSDLRAKGDDPSASYRMTSISTPSAS